MSDIHNRFNAILRAARKFYSVRCFSCEINSNQDCIYCGGSGVEYLPDYDCKIVSTVLMTWTSAIYHLYSNGEFTRVEEALSVVFQWLLEIAKQDALDASASGNADLKNENNARMASIVIDEICDTGRTQNLKISGSPLSLQELIDLGIEEE